MKFYINMYQFDPIDSRASNNPVGYTRTTQGIKSWHNNANAKRMRIYERWKDFVWSKVPDKKFRINSDEKVYLGMKIFFENKRHSDPSNIFKGIEDALADKFGKLAGKKVVIERRCYKDDKQCAGCFNYDYIDKGYSHIVIIIEKDFNLFHKQLNQIF